MACNICCWAGPFYPFVGVLLKPFIAAPLMAAPLMAAPLMAGSSHKDGWSQEGYSISMINTLLSAVFPR